jgi:predicted transcriptional regulator
LIRQQERLIFKGLGDLLVELQRVGEAKSFWQEIEISHKNTSKDLRGKDKNLHFYCLTENQKNKVARYTGAASYVLGDPFLVEAFQSGELAPSKYEGHDQETELSEAHQSVHEAIERLGGMATIGVLSALLGKARSTVNESLLKLFRTRFVRQADVCLKPGWNSGRPNALYLTGIDGNVEVEELRRGLSRSLITQFLVSYNRHQFAGYDSKSGILTTVAAEGMVAKYHLFFDDQRLSVEELLEKTLALEQQFRGTEKVNFRLILHNEKRYSAVEAELRRAKSQVQAVNIFTVMEQVNRLTKQKREAKRKVLPAKAPAIST